MLILPVLLILAVLVGAAALVLKIFKKPLKILLKLLVNTLIGFAALILINYLGHFVGIAIGVNWVNAAIVGVLGVPGVALLLILQLLL